MQEDQGIDAHVEKLWNDAVAARRQAKLPSSSVRERVDYLIEGIAYATKGAAYDPKNLLFRNLKGTMLHSLYG
jgi:hypothetical protein